MGRMRPIIFKAPEQLVEELQRRASVERTTMSEVVRRALFLYLYLDPLNFMVCWQKALDEFESRFKHRTEDREIKPARLKFKD